MCAAVPCFVWAGWKLMPVISRFIKSQSFYTSRLWGFDKAIRKNMSYPTVSYHDGGLWDVKWAESKAMYDLLSTETMNKIFIGALRFVQEIKVPQIHRK